MIRGVLFDMDGVLVDSEEFICRAAMMMFSEHGVTVKPEDFVPFTGMGENKYIGGVAEKYGVKTNIEKLKARTYQIYEEIVKGKLAPLPGSHEFISKCRSLDFKLALATSTDTVKMRINLRETGLTEDQFDAIITGVDVERKKPFPDIYIKAAEMLGLNPDDCLVVEDAVSGVRAGKAAGCKCLAVTTSFEAGSLKEADWIFNSLKDVPDTFLNKLKD